jgi:hypothetical protein
VIKGQREGEGLVEWGKVRMKEEQRERRDKVRRLMGEDIEREG